MATNFYHCHFFQDGGQDYGQRGIGCSCQSHSLDFTAELRLFIPPLGWCQDFYCRVLWLQKSPVAHVQFKGFVYLWKETRYPEWLTCSFRLTICRQCSITILVRIEHAQEEERLSGAKEMGKRNPPIWPCLCIYLFKFFFFLGGDLIAVTWCLQFSCSSLCIWEKFFNRKFGYTEPSRE